MSWKSWNRITSLAVLCAAMMCARHASAASIAWVSFHGDAAVPTTNAANAGFTEAPDKAYTDLLQSAGHTVTRFTTADNFNTAQLLGFNLVILGRGVNSGHYQQDPETLAWNSLPTALMDMSGYTLRANRLGYATGDTIPDTAGDIRLTAANPAHPIFSGIVFDGSNTMVNTYAGLVSYTPMNPAAPNVPAVVPLVQRGISVVTSPLIAGAQVLATVGTAGDPAVGGAVIAYLPLGTVMNTAGADPDDVLGGNRLVFLSGSREANGFTGDGSGMYDLTPTGAHMFLNAVTFIAGPAIPEPSSALLFALSGLALGAFRKR